MEDRRNLPEAFRMRMKRLLGTEWEAFQASYDKERSYGLRRNPLKSSGERFMAQTLYFGESKLGRRRILLSGRGTAG